MSNSHPSCSLKALSPKQMEGRGQELFSTTQDTANKKIHSVSAFRVVQLGWGTCETSTFSVQDGEYGNRSHRSTEAQKHRVNTINQSSHNVGDRV